MVTVQASDLFWETLSQHRSAPYYRKLRSKVLRFSMDKVASNTPVSAADRPFQNAALKDIWHLNFFRNPDTTLFYAVRGHTVTLCMIGDHSDYGFRGKNISASFRTADRINNATARAPMASPEWKDVRWSDPLDILNHPDVPEMSYAGLSRLNDELCAEMHEPDRFGKKHGISLFAVKEHQFLSYVNDLQRASEMVQGLMRMTDRHDYWQHNIADAKEFVREERVLGMA